MDANTDKKLKLNVVSPTIQCDGNAIGINEDGTVNLLFFQITDRKEDHFRATSISVTRLTEEQLDSLAGTIKEALEDLKKNKKE